MLREVTIFLFSVSVAISVDTYILWNSQDAFRVLLATAVNFVILIGATSSPMNPGQETLAFHEIDLVAFEKGLSSTTLDERK